MPKQTSDRKQTPVSTLTTVETKPPADKGAEKDICRVFVSRKTTDRQIFGRASANRKKLKTFAPGRLQIFDADEIKPGQDWRKKIRQEIQKADILLLILTRPARKDFDWPLYEAGLFDSLRGDKRLVCIYPKKKDPKKKGGPPDQLADIQGVEATEANLRDFLVRLFTDSEFTNTETPLNADVYEAFPEQIDAIARETYEDVNGVQGEGIYSVSYVNPYIQLLLPSGTKKLTGDTQIKSNMRSLRTLFKLRKEPPESEYWTWAQIEESVDFGREDPQQFNRAWMREAEAAIEKLLKGKSEDHQIHSRFIAKDSRIWSPEIEIWRAYDNGIKTVDVTFSPDVQDEWLQKAKAPVALAANLNLAVRIRHDLIETYLRRLPHWEDGDESHFLELSDLVSTVERNGFFIRWLTKDAWAEAFDIDDTEKVIKMEKDFGQKIYPKLHKALDEKKVKEASDALKLWHTNNTDFLSIGIPQYTRLLKLDT